MESEFMLNKGKQGECRTKTSSSGVRMWYGKFNTTSNGCIVLVGAHILWCVNATRQNNGKWIKHTHILTTNYCHPYKCYDFYGLLSLSFVVFIVDVWYWAIFKKPMSMHIKSL